jgi:tetratricopeptide (TPR) repeat protein
MKFLSSNIIAIIIIASVGCQPKLFNHTSLNHESTDSRGNVMLLGQCTRQRLQQAPFNEWFTKNYNDYSVDTATAEKIKSKLRGKHLVIFMGTWCGDSRREVPRIFKILDYCGVKSTKIDLIMLDNHDSVYKQSPAHEERGLNIHRVPDLLVFEKRNELGRIVESPVVSLEKDLLAIANGDAYTPNYKAVVFLVNSFKQNNIDEIENNLPALSNQLKPLASGSSELNTYGYVLMAGGEMKKAGIVFKLNTLLYPDNANAFDSFGEYYFKTGNKILAKENYQKALQLQPDNENAKKMAEQLK